MGRLGNSPSSRGYATPTYSTTQITARETFGGPAKAGLGRHIGMGEWTFGAIVNGSSGRSGHTAPPFAGMNFPKAFYAGRLPYLHYPISKTNQLARVGVGTTGGMTRTPADGVNTEQRKAMKLRVGHWNAFWPARPIRDTPNNCCYVDPVGKMDLNNVTIFSMRESGDVADVDIKVWNTLDDVYRNFIAVPPGPQELFEYGAIDVFWKPKYDNDTNKNIAYLIFVFNGELSIQEIYDNFVTPSVVSAGIGELTQLLKYNGALVSYNEAASVDG